MRWTWRGEGGHYLGGVMRGKGKGACCVVLNPLRRLEAELLLTKHDTEGRGGRRLVRDVDSDDATSHLTG